MKGAFFCGKRGEKLFLKGRKGRRKIGGEGSFFMGGERVILEVNEGEMR